MWHPAWLRNLMRRRSLDRELDDELRAYVDLLTAEYQQRGFAPDAARQAARREAGALDRIKENVRETRSGFALETLWRDVTFGLRLLRRTPAFAATAILSLALGIGSNAAVFGLLNALQLRSLPVPNPHELAEIRLDGPRCCRHTGRNRQMSMPLWREIERQQQAFAGLFAFADTRFNLAPQGEVRYVDGLYVSGTFFPVLGIMPAIGRTIGPADDRPGCASPAAVISQRLWQSEFGGRGDVLSQTLRVGSRQYPIAGVTPADFFGVEVGRHFEVALPLCAAGFDRPDHWWLAVMGRLEPGWTAEQADAHLAALGPSLLGATVPPNYNVEQARQFTTLRFSVRPAFNGVSPLRAQYEDPLWLLLAIAALVLVTACANVATLSLIRATIREPELALRFALGASRLRVVRQLLVEGALVAAAGALAGLVMARLTHRAVLTLLSTRTDPIVLDISLDWRMLAFSGAIVGLTTIAFALMPALRTTRQARIGDSSSRTTAGRGRMALREVLIAAQVGISVVLVSSALLFAATLYNLSTLDAGFNTRGLLVANVFLRSEQYPAETRAAAHRRLTEQLAALPDVAAVAHASTPPLGGSSWDTVVRARTAAGEVRGETLRNQVSAGYFRVMEIGLLAGRDFAEQDTRQSSRVAVVNETFARRLFGDPRPLGRTVIDGESEFEIVGVVKDSKQYFIREDFRPIVYTAASQVAEPGTTIRFIIRPRVGLSSGQETVRQALARFDPTASVRFATMEDMAAESLMRERLMAGLSGFFGAIAIALAAVGVYGVAGYTVASRQREIGIRVALGATASHIVRAVLGRLVAVAIAGLTIGLLVAVQASRAAESLLYGINPRDPSTLAVIVAILTAAAAIAAAAPARRALHTDPVVALKAE